MDEKQKKIATELGKAGLSCVPVVGLGMWVKSFNSVPSNERGWMFWGEGAAQLLSAGAATLTFGSSAAVTAPLMAAIGTARVAKTISVANGVANTIYAGEAVVAVNDMANGQPAANPQVPTESPEMIAIRERQQKDDEARAILTRQREEQSATKDKDPGASILVGMIAFVTAGMLSKKGPAEKSYNDKVGGGTPASDFELTVSKEISVV